jgi:hypothetical protein
MHLPVFSTGFIWLVDGPTVDHFSSSGAYYHDFSIEAIVDYCPGPNQVFQQVLSPVAWHYDAVNKIF